MPGEPITALLVEDDPVVLDLSALIVEAAGCNVIPRVSGEIARDEIDDGLGFDLLISDISMEPVSGIELADFTLIRRPGVPIVLISGRPKFSFDSTIFDHPSVAFLQKPYFSSELKSIISLSLKKSAP